VMAPFIQTRKVRVCIQDFCNFLEGGLVSMSTLSAETVNALAELSAGSLVCYYDFDRSDILSPALMEGDGRDVGQVSNVPHTFFLVCWRGHNATLNVMCGKTGNCTIAHTYFIIDSPSCSFISLSQFCDTL
jgi:hypothetical protein